MNKTMSRNISLKVFIKEFVAPLAVATVVLLVLLYGHVPL